MNYQPYVWKKQIFYNCQRFKPNQVCAMPQNALRESKISQDSVHLILPESWLRQVTLRGIIKVSETVNRR